MRIVRCVRLSIILEEEWILWKQFGDRCDHNFVRKILNMRVIKRNGKTAAFNPKKIRNAIRKAGFVDDESLDKIVDVVTTEAQNRNGKISIEEIQDLVELELMKTGNEKVAREYIRYRKMREMIRENELTN